MSIYSSREYGLEDDCCFLASPAWPQVQAFSCWSVYRTFREDNNQSDPATPGSMRSWLISLALLANVAISSGPATVEAVACAEICYTTALTGFGPGGTPGCTCSGSQQGARRGDGDCNCGQCYEKTQGVVFGFAINADGTCTYGTDCGTCEYSAASPNGSTGTNSSSGAVTAAPTPTPTPTPVPTTSAPSPSPVTTPVTTPDAGSSSTSLSTTGSIGASSSSSKSSDGVGGTTGSHSGSEVVDKGLSKWQIVLAICCCTLFFLVAVVSVCTCYCKARSRLYEHEEDMANYYDQPTPTVQAWTAPNAIATKTNVNIV
ncbi:hypothetical protein P3T76_011458 [Phytophthora citrophthora]|uniref:Uncharacterized protein n=1 Tax=Phytophthora citrophthora TaxID=4793 RepID=A0AAD9G9I0_9STRA|nr:hypothetical protein P3T76_011458 [Phytophthora citrophthora]